MPAASTKVPEEFWNSHPNPHVRLLGRDSVASAVLAEAARRGDALFRLPSAPTGAGTDVDYTQIDSTLPLARDDVSVADPLPRTSYAGMNPVQRRRFANWLTAPEMAAPVAFHHLYLAWLESALFAEESRKLATAELFSLLAAAGWRGEKALAQAALLAGWLAQDGSLIAQAMTQGDLTPGVLTVAAGWLAYLGESLNAACALALARSWNLQSPVLDSVDPASDGGLLHLRITSLASSLGADPLAWALAQTDPATVASGSVAISEKWLPWHSIHRDLRLYLPQIDLRPALAPRLADLFASLPVAVAQSTPQPELSIQKVEVAKPAEWNLILEFGNSRSQHYDYVIHLARKQAGYQILMDESRQLIHRIHFRKRHMRQFWRMWSYVESWSATRVYVNGEEVKKWSVFPYSAEMR